MSRMWMSNADELTALGRCGHVDERRRDFESDCATNHDPSNGDAIVTLTGNSPMRCCISGTPSPL
jgi:hypothetical protein